MILLVRCLPKRVKRASVEMLRVKKGHDQLENPRRCDWNKSCVESDKEECGKADAFQAVEISAIPARKLFRPGQELHMTDRMRYEL